MTGADVSPWERQPGETPKAFQAFQLYRDLGPGQRSVRRVARELTKSGSIVSRWSSAHDWVARCEAWDAEEDRKLRAEQDRVRREMVDRHANLAKRMSAVVIQRLVGVPGQVQALNPSDLTHSELTRWVDTLVKVERLSRGAPDTIVEHAGEVGLDEAGRGSVARRVLADPKARALSLAALEAAFGDDAGTPVEGQRMEGA